MKKGLKVVGAVVLAPIVLMLLLAVLFYLPPIQNWAVRQISALASDKTGMAISVSHVSLAFPLDLAVDGVTIVSRADSIAPVGDTIADVRRIVADVRLLPLLRAKVEVDAFAIESARFDTHRLIASTHVRGSADALRLVSHGVDLSQQTVTLDEVALRGGDVDIALCDTMPEDTTKSDNRWVIALRRLTVSDTAARLSMSGDSLRVAALLGDATVADALIDLGKGSYTVGRADLRRCKASYDQTHQPPAEGLDYSHLAMSDVEISLDSFAYHSPDLRVRVQKVAFTEKSGLRVEALSGVVAIDSLRLSLPLLTATTAHSHLRLSGTMDWDTFAATSPGQMAVRADGELGVEDLAVFAGFLPQQLFASAPRYPLMVSCDVDGNMSRLNINKLTADMPTAFRASATGHLGSLLDTRCLSADVTLDATTYNTDFLTAAFLPPSTAEMIHIPDGTRLDARLQAHGENYTLSAEVGHGDGWLNVDAVYGGRAATYDASLEASDMPLQLFVSDMGLSPFSGRVDVKGAGFDLFSPSTTLKAEAAVDTLMVKGFNLSAMTATVGIDHGEADVDLVCRNQLLRGTISVDALMDTKRVRATVACSLDDADLYNLKIAEKPLNTSLCAHVDVASNLDDFFRIDGYVSDVVIRDSLAIYRPEDLRADIVTRSDTTWVKVGSGDMNLDLAAKGGYKSLMNVADNLNKELKRQIDNKYIQHDSLRQVLPVSHLDFSSGPNNILARYAAHIGYDYRRVNAQLRSSPTEGLDGFVQIDTLKTSGMRIDSIRVDLATGDDGFKYKARVSNAKDNPQICFRAMLDGSLFATGSDINLVISDAHDYVGLRLGLQAMLERGGIRVRLADTDAVIGYRQFKANDDNYVFVADNKRVAANMLLRADDGTGLQLYSDNENLEALQDITLALNKIDIAEIASVLPYFPKVSGILNGDFHAILTEEHLSVSSSLAIDSLVYEGNKMGDVASEFVYMPMEGGRHFVDMMLLHNGNDVGTVRGTYSHTTGGDVLDADLNLDRLPLDWVNGFVPDQIVGMRGDGVAHLKLNGKLDALDINGDLTLHDAYIVSVPYGVEMRFDEKPLKIDNSKVVFEDFRMYSHNNQPLVIGGNVDLSDLSRIKPNLSMRARNFLLVDSKQTRKSQVFGKAYINFAATMRGPLSALDMRGRVDVLGSTNMTYVMRDSPLTNDNRLAELVTFVDFNDKIVPQVERPTIEGLAINLTINIDQGARLFCQLNASNTNYLDLIGGGSLRLVYSADEMRLNGRYTISNGEMKYSLPVIPLKTFDIRDGSYVEFKGDVTNPTLNITAMEETTANVTADGTSRAVRFNCGVVITKTLNDMGLEFAIEAPEDLTINSDLMSKSVEERGQVAVTMLTTGMYLTDSNTSSFTMNNALSSFLQKEINNITGNALRTLDLSVGLDNTTDAAGVLHTDYSFKFAKRFWNNRINVVVGGKVSTTDAMNESLFNNVALEYRLDQSANTNIKLFYDRAKYDYLEGYVGQYGVGLVWKRKVQKITDFFRFKTTPKITTAKTTSPWAKTSAAGTLATPAERRTAAGDSLSSVTTTAPDSLSHKATPAEGLTPRTNDKQ